MDYHNFFQLTEQEKVNIIHVLEKIPYDPFGSDSYINEIRKAMLTCLPTRISTALNRQRASINPRPYIVFRNTPTDHEVFFSPSPDHYTPSAKSGSISENFLVGIAALIGEPYSMYFEGKELINNLIPKQAASQEYTGLGFDVELDFHIENVALKHLGHFDVAPVGVLLTGVRHDPQGPLTWISDARRDRFTPGFDANGTPLRWIQRVFVAHSLWNHRNINQVSERIFSI